jgi:hypothetical protein
MLGFSQQLVGALAVQGMALSAVATPVPVYLFTVAAALAAWLFLFVLPAADPSPGR